MGVVVSFASGTTWCRGRSSAAPSRRRMRSAYRFARRERQIHSAQRTEAASDRFGQVERRGRFVGERFAHDVPRLVLHRTLAMGRANAQARLGALVQIEYRDSRHARRSIEIKDSIVVNEARRLERASAPGARGEKKAEGVAPGRWATWTRGRGPGHPVDRKRVDRRWKPKLGIW